jgi:hypothetical protein
MVYAAYVAFPANNPNQRRYTMKVSQAIDFHLQYHQGRTARNVASAQETQHAYTGTATLSTGKIAEPILIKDRHQT